MGAGLGRVWLLQEVRLVTGVKVVCPGWVSSAFLCCCWLALSRLPCTAEISHVSKTCSHSFCKLHGRGLSAAVKAGDAEEDGLRLGVVAGSISVGDHRAITAEHLHGCGHLEKGTGQKQLTGAFSREPVRMWWVSPEFLRPRCCFFPCLSPRPGFDQSECGGTNEWTW